MRLQKEAPRKPKSFSIYSKGAFNNYVDKKRGRGGPLNVLATT